MEIEIRKMTDADLLGALRVLEEYGMAPTPDRADAERSALDVGNAFVALAGDRIVGVAGYIVHSKTYAETASLAVLPEAQGLSVGYRLQTARLDEMRARGILTVRTETDRPETVEWYVRMFGYRVTGTNPKKHAFSREDVDDWTVLELDLS